MQRVLGAMEGMASCSNMVLVAMELNPRKGLDEDLASVLGAALDKQVSKVIRHPPPPPPPPPRLAFFLILLLLFHLGFALCVVCAVWRGGV